MSSIRSHVRWDFIAQVSLLTFLFAYLFFFNSTDYDFMDAGKALAGIILMTSIGLAWLLRGRRASTSLGIPILLYCAVFALTSATSIDPRRSFGEGVYLLAAIFIFYVSAEMVAAGIPRTLILLALAVGGGIYMAFLWLPAILWYRAWLAASPGQWIPSITYRLPTPTVNSFFLNVLCFLGIMGIIQAKGWPGRILSVIYSLSALGLSFLASARSAWLGAGAGLLLLAFFCVRAYRSQLLAAWQVFRRRLWLLIVTLLAALLLVAAGGYVLYRQAVHPTHGAIIDSRQPYWGPALQTFLAHPILGAGPATYPAAFLAANSVPPSEFFPHAHSVPLNILAEMGLAGLLAFLLLYAAAWRRLFSRLRLSPAGERPLLWAVSGLLLCFSVQGFFDCYHLDPMGLWALLIVLGVASSSSISYPPARLLSSRLPARRFLAPGLWARPWWLLLFFAAAWTNYLVFQPFYQGVQAADRSDWPAAAAYLQVAAARDPSHAIAQQQFGLAELVLASQGDPAALDTAIRAFGTAVRLDPAYAINHLNLGALYLHRARPGDLQAAVLEFSAATQKAPQDSVTWLNLGVAYETGGQSNAALQAYAQALALDPTSYEAYFWRSSPLRLQAAAAWRQHNLPAPAPALADLERAASADSANGANWVRLAEAYLQSGRLGDASRSLDLANLGFFSIGVDPLAGDWLQAELAAAKGDFVGAARTGQAVLDRYLFQGAFGPGATSSMTQYAQLAFRRPVMLVEYVPWVQTIPLPDLWGRRLSSLISWSTLSGDLSHAAQLQQQLLQLIPDFPQ